MSLLLFLLSAVFVVCLLAAVGAELTPGRAAAVAIVWIGLLTYRIFFF